MQLLSSLAELFRHMEWADATVWRGVATSEKARSDSTLKTRLHHIHLVQWAFLKAWTAQPYEPGAGATLDLPSLLRWGRAYHRDVQAFLGTVTESALDRPVVVPWAKAIGASLGRDLSVPSLGETLLHITAHSTHHRGQVNARLGELGVAPQPVDYIVWLWYGKPEPEWPST